MKPRMKPVIFLLFYSISILEISTAVPYIMHMKFTFESTASM